MLAVPRQAPGHLAENVMHFARVLRSAGMAVGTDRVELTLQALKLAGRELSRSKLIAAAESIKGWSGDLAKNVSYAPDEDAFQAALVHGETVG